MYTLSLLRQSAVGGKLLEKVMNEVIQDMKIALQEAIAYREGWRSEAVFYAVMTCNE